MSKKKEVLTENIVTNSLPTCNPWIYVGLAVILSLAATFIITAISDQHKANVKELNDQREDNCASLAVDIVGDKKQHVYLPDSNTCRIINNRTYSYSLNAIDFVAKDSSDTFMDTVLLMIKVASAKEEYDQEVFCNRHEDVCKNGW